MMKLVKLIAASAATLLAAGCVAYPYYDDPYYSNGYSNGYAYNSPPPATYAPPPVVTYYYDYDYSPPRRYYYRDGHRDYSRDESRGRYWRDHRYYDGH